MVDVDTFLTTLYVLVDDFCMLALSPAPHPGPQAALSRSEVVTLALCGPWQGFGSARGFYRSAQRHLWAALPALPTREPYKRQVRQQQAALVACLLSLVQLLGAQRWAYEALDSAGAQPAMPSVGARAGGPGWRLSAGAIAWAGMQASCCCWRSPR